MDEVDSCVNMLEEYSQKDRGNKHGLKLEVGVFYNDILSELRIPLVLFFKVNMYI